MFIAAVESYVPVAASQTHSGVDSCDIVSPHQISDDVAKAGAVKPVQHTRIRRGIGVNVY